MISKNIVSGGMERRQDLQSSPCFHDLFKLKEDVAWVDARVEGSSLQWTVQVKKVSVEVWKDQCFPSAMQEMRSAQVPNNPIRMEIYNQ